MLNRVSLFLLPSLYGAEHIVAITVAVIVLLLLLMNGAEHNVVVGVAVDAWS